MVASNRGPISVTAVDDGEDQVDRGGGGLVSGLLAALKDRDDVVWVCAALNDAERALAREADHGHVSGSHSSVDLLDGVGVRMLPIDATTFRQAYNGIANSSLWLWVPKTSSALIGPWVQRPWPSWNDLWLWVCASST